MKDVRLPDKFADPDRFRFVQVELHDIRRVQIHGGYRSRSSSSAWVLSPDSGSLAQIACIERKIRAFLAAAIPVAVPSGRSSATGSPRRSMMMTSPSAASRTNSDVWICNSRMEVFLTCYIVALLK